MRNYLDESVLDSLLEGFQIIDFDWRYAYVNQTVAMQGKSSKKAILGNKMTEMYPGIENTNMFKALERCMSSRTSENFENEFTYPDGSKGWFELRIQPVPEGLFILSVDISERKRAESNLLLLNESLESLVALRTTELNLRNKDLTDSIEYAKRIQGSRLPKKEEIFETFPQCFLLFKPKDIVSGDFYFFSKTNSVVHLACADCTGHGVPGALMSMIGSEKLEKAVSGFVNPSDILNHLNKEIKYALRQTEKADSIRDGMDIAFCSLSTNSSLLQFAGANRPLWIIRKDKMIIEEIKPTKKAIGGLTADDQHFETRTIQLQKGDTFYMFSDGYADSFGGKLGKKLMVKKFRQLLLDIQHLSMPEQEIHLDSFIESWKGTNEQVDDILVIGVKL